MYGGRQWRWPWSLIDGSGYTAMHLAAAQPQASACVALLETVKRMLPGQIPAAHTAWLHEQGTIRMTPSQVFATLHPEEASDSLWEQHSSEAAKPVPASEPQAVAGGSSSAGPAHASGTDAVSKAAGASDTTGKRPSDALTDSEPLPSFWGLLREAWRWRQPPEYESWALRQVRHWLAHKSSTLMQACVCTTVATSCM